jgi:hypothetical protein
MIRRTLMAIGVATAAFGCSIDEPRPARGEVALTPLEPATLVSVAPSDLMTSIAATPLMIYLDYGPGGLVETSVLEAVADAVELRTYPELEPVEHQVNLEPSDPLSLQTQENTAGRAAIEVVPAQSLANRWYVLCISALPSLVRANVRTGNTQAAHLGAVVARFNPGSAPVLQSLALCPNGAATVSFSENVVATPGLTTALVLKRTGAGNCAMLPPIGDAPASIGFTCATDVSSSLVSLTAAQGISGSSDIPLGHLDGQAVSNSALVSFGTATYSVDLGTAPMAGGGCRVWRP